MRKFAFTAAVVALSAGLAFSPPPATAQSGNDPVVAVVNGYEIFMSDIERARSQLPPQAQQYPAGIVFNILLENMVTARLVADEARKQGYHKQTEVQRTMARIEDQVLQQEILTRHIQDNLTDDAVKARYDQFLKENPPLDEVRARHILVETEEKARAVITRIGKGEDFGKVAREVSTGPSGKVGGDLGYFSREKMVPEFSAAAFKLQPGDVTKSPVKTQFGWHVIKIEDRRTQDAPSFEQAEPQLRQQVQESLSESFVAELRQKAKIETFGPEGRPDPK